MALLIGVSIPVVACYGGFVGWPWWTILPLVVLMALTKANLKASDGDNQLMETLVRAAVNVPLMLVFVAIAFSLGYGLKQFITAS